MSTYNIYVNCLTVYLSIRGENPKEHAVRQELVTFVQFQLSRIATLYDVAMCLCIILFHFNCLFMKMYTV